MDEQDSNSGASVDTLSLPVIGGLSVFTVKLIEKLKSMEIGDTATDEELGELCGRTTAVGGRGYNSLRTAMRYVRRHFGVVIERCHRQGRVKRLGDEETITSSKGDLRSIRRRSATAMQKLAAVDRKSLDGEPLQEFNALVAQTGTLQVMSRNDATKRLAENKIDREVDMRRLLEAMK